MEGPNGINIEQELNDIIGKKNLLGYSGFKQYIGAVYNFYQYKNQQILEHTKTPMNSESLQILNLLIAERNALESLLLVNKEFEDSVNPIEESLKPYEDK